MTNIKRDSAGHFAPGVSANPGGKAKMPDDVKAALKAASPEAVALLVQVMRNPKEKTAYRLEAAKTILDRAYGKPVQAQDISFDVDTTADVMTQIRRVAMEMSNNGQRIDTDDTDDKKALLLKIAASLPKDILEDCLRVLANDKSEEMTNER